MRSINMAMSKSGIRSRIAAVRVPKTLRSKAKEILANPVARELLAAALVNIAVALVHKQSAKGSAARRLIGDIGDTGFQAGKLGSMTINQLFDTLLGAHNRSHSGSAAVRRPEERTRRPRTPRRMAKSRKSPARRLGEEGEVTAIH
jgi:hypothetical protein